MQVPGGTRVCVSQASRGVVGLSVALLDAGMGQQAGIRVGTDRAVPSWAPVQARLRCGGRETKASKASVRNPKICIRGLLYPIPRGGGQAVSAGAPRNASGSEGSVIDRFEEHQLRWPVGKASIRRTSISRSFEFEQLMDNGRALWRAWLPSINFLKRTTSTSSWFENEIRVCKPRRRSLCVQQLVQPNSVHRSCSSHVLENIVAGLAVKWQFSGVDYINIEWIWERNSGLQTQRRPEKTFVLAATRTAIVRALVVFRQRVSSIQTWSM